LAAGLSAPLCEGQNEIDKVFMLIDFLMASSIVRCQKILLHYVT
jgi:hypothetical protein